MGFGWTDALEFLPPVRAGEELYQAGKDVSHGHFGTAAQHVGIAALDTYPITAGVMEGFAISDAVSGGRVDKDVVKPVAEKAGVTVDPGGSDPKDTPIGNAGKAIDDAFDWLKWLWKNIKWVALIGGGIFILILVLVIGVR